MSRGPKPNHRLSDEGWLREQLRTDKTYAEIAEEAGAGTAGAVSYWLDEHGIDGRLEAKRPADGELEELYVRERMSMAGVADELGVTTKTVFRWLHERGIETRGGGGGGEEVEADRYAKMFEDVTGNDRWEL